MLWFSCHPARRTKIYVLIVSTSPRILTDGDWFFICVLIWRGIWLDWYSSMRTNFVGQNDFIQRRAAAQVAAKEWLLMTESLNELHLTRRAVSLFTGIQENTLAPRRCFGGAINIGDSLAVAWSPRGGNNGTRTHRTFCYYIFFVSFPLNAGLKRFEQLRSTRDVWIIDWNTRIVKPIYIPDNNVLLRLKVKWRLFERACSICIAHVNIDAPIYRRKSIDIVCIDTIFYNIICI